MDEAEVEVEREREERNKERERGKRVEPAREKKQTNEERPTLTSRTKATLPVARHAAPRAMITAPSAATTRASRDSKEAVMSPRRDAPARRGVRFGEEKRRPSGKRV